MLPQTLFLCLFFLTALPLAVRCIPRELYVPAGSKCHNSNIPGTCISITNCSLAVEAVKKQGFHSLKRCGFVRFTEIVCCPNNELRHVKTTETPSTTDDDGVDDDKKPQIRAPDVGRKSQKACDKYSKNLPIVLSYHIVGGEKAEEGEFPHMAALGFFAKEDNVYKFHCGATLISNCYIVTAAHCINNTLQNDLKIARLGVVNVPATVAKPDPKIDYNVIDVKVHSEFNWTKRINDIALVKLEKKVTFSEFIRPACLYTKNDDPERLFVTGWGAVNREGEWNSILQKAILNPVPLHECNQTYLSITTKNIIIIKAQLCAADGTSDTCQGDSGGPLQTQSNRSLFTLVGITSFGSVCGSKYPGVYTRISSYVDWIEEIVWP